MAVEGHRVAAVLLRELRDGFVKGGRKVAGRQRLLPRERDFLGLAFAAEEGGVRWQLGG